MQGNTKIRTLEGQVLAANLDEVPFQTKGESTRGLLRSGIKHQMLCVQTNNTTSILVSANQEFLRDNCNVQGRNQVQWVPARKLAVGDLISSVTETQRIKSIVPKKTLAITYESHFDLTGVLIANGLVVR